MSTDRIISVCAVIVAIASFLFGVYKTNVKSNVEHEKRFSKLETRLENFKSGEIGPRGPEGPRGPQGPRGERGYSANLSSWSNCITRTIGYNKSHGFDSSSWCPDGYFITALDFDGGGAEGPGNYPIVRSVTCCRLK